MRDYARLRKELQQDLALDEPRPLTSDMSTAEAASSSLLSAFYKKLCPTGVISKEAEAAALAKFLRINDVTGRWVLSIQSESDSYLWDLFRDSFGLCIASGGDFDLERIAEGLSTGPGASQLADSSNIVTKLFGGVLSYYSDFTLRLYRSAIASTGLWANAEMARHLRFGEQKVVGGTLFFVPKTTDIARTCCTEANVDMLIQKAIGAFLETCLDRFYGITLDDQPDQNRLLCKLGSAYGAFGTTDLASASDSISVELIRQLPLPPFLRAVMRESAGDKAVLPDGSIINKGMISTMGNGFTFPLQTIIFACAVRAVYIAKGIPLRCPLGRPTFGVFGDDIIVRSDAYESVNSFLRLLGFEVNGSKSFNTGPFRESCGHDYFNGFQIRGVYISSLETVQDVASAFNRLARWSARHGVLLNRTLALLRSWLPDKLPLVPPCLGDDEGVHVPFSLCKPRVSDTYWFKYRYWKRVVKRVELPEPDEYQPGADALGVGILSGHIRRREESIRTPGKQPLPPLCFTKRERPNEPPHYKIATSTVPYWDYLPSGILEERIPREGNSWDSWKAILAGLLVRD